jgi:hypothetical protein
VRWLCLKQESHHPKSTRFASALSPNWVGWPQLVHRVFAEDEKCVCELSSTVSEAVWVPETLIN